MPAGREPVQESRYDFRHGARLGAVHIDSAFTDLHRDDSGQATVRLTGVDGRTVELWVDHHYSYIELFTGDTLAPNRRRRGIGCEPMTCPPNAFADGPDIIRLEPGASITTSWGVRLR